MLIVSKPLTPLIEMMLCKAWSFLPSWKTSSGSWSTPRFQEKQEMHVVWSCLLRTQTCLSEILWNSLSQAKKRKTKNDRIRRTFDLTLQLLHQASQQLSFGFRCVSRIAADQKGTLGMRWEWARFGWLDVAKTETILCCWIVIVNLTLRWKEGSLGMP